MSKTSNSKLLKYFLSMLILCVANTMNGQFNMKVGYSFSHTNLEQTKSIFDRFNTNNPQSEKPLSPIKNYHGIELGLRYKFKHFGVDFGVTSNSGNTETLNVFQTNGSLDNDKWSISLVNYSLGLENYFGTFGYGASIGIQKLKYKTDFNRGQNKVTIFDESVLNSKFYFILEVPSNKIAFSIRPFISTTWQPYNIQAIELALDPQSTRPESEFDQNVLVYGISFLFLNGPQRR